MQYPSELCAYRRETSQQDLFDGIPTIGCILTGEDRCCASVCPYCKEEKDA